MGLFAFDSPEVYTLKEGLLRFGGRTLTVEVTLRKEAVARARVVIGSELSRPVGIVSDAEGRMRNAIQHDQDPVYVTLANLPKSSQIRVFLVPRQGDWAVTDPIEPVRDRNGRPVVIDHDGRQGLQAVALAKPGQLLPGAYDLIVRPVRFGFEEDEELVLLRSDLVIGRHITGLVVREEFWRGKPVLGGCVNAVPMSGSSVAGRPYFRYRDTFVVGENIWAALDPGIVLPGAVREEDRLLRHPIEDAEPSGRPAPV